MEPEPPGAAPFGWSRIREKGAAQASVQAPALDLCLNFKLQRKEVNKILNSDVK